MNYGSAGIRAPIAKAINLNPLTLTPNTELNNPTKSMHSFVQSLIYSKELLLQVLAPLKLAILNTKPLTLPLCASSIAYIEIKAYTIFSD